MCKSIESLKAQILAAVEEEGAHLCGCVDALWEQANAKIADLEEKLLKKDAILRLKDREIVEHKRTIAKLRKMKFGSSADRNPSKQEKPKPIACDGDHTQQPSPLKGQENGSGEGTKDKHHKNLSPKRTSSGRGRRTWPEHLERRVVYMGKPDQKCACGCGGSAIGYDTTETLEVIPATFYVAVRKHPKCRCLVEGKIKGTPVTPRLFSHTCATNAILAHTITMRYAWQMPLYRQQAMLKAQGIDLNRSTMTNWLNRVANEALIHVFELMERELKRTGGRLYMDETSLPQLQPGMGKTRNTTLYALLRDDRSFGGKSPPIILYYHRPTRAMHEIHDILHGFRGTLQTDAYPGYGQVGNKGTSSEGSTRVKCWAHARRNFTDEYEFNQTQDAATITELIAELYRIEKEVREQPPHIRQAHRQKFSVPVLAGLKAFLHECSERHLKKSKMGKAIQYVLKLWDELALFVDDGRIDLDTNAVERMFKPIILLRKNALFVGSERGGQTWAILASIVETCKLNRVNVEPYLTWVLDQIAAKLPRSEYGKLLPWNAPTEYLVSS